MKTLVLGLGNEILADDGVGVFAARALKDEFLGQAEIVESSLSGLALLDLFIGFNRAIIIDAIKTDRFEPGSLYELAPEELGKVISPSPHYSGLPEILALAKQLDLEFPTEIKIFALEVEDPYTVGGKMTVSAEEGLKKMIVKVRAQLHLWGMGKTDA
jgi:hydrogenase maturation protease